MAKGGIIFLQNQFQNLDSFIKMYGCSMLSWEVTVIYIIASPLKRGLPPKKQDFAPFVANLLLLEQIHTLRGNPSFEGLCQLGKQTGSRKSCSP